MERVIDNLESSYETDPRPLVLVYQQMIEEWPPWQATKNLELLNRVAFLAGRTLDPPSSAIDRRVLKQFIVRVYESPEISRS